MKKNREIFLNRIRERLKGTTPVPLERKLPQWKQLANLSQEELLEVFKKRLQVNHTHYSETTRDVLKDHLLELLGKYNCTKVVLHHDKRNQECGLDQMGDNWHIWDPAIGKQNVAIAEKADVAITFPDMTLAESGTLVIHADPNKGRTTSLLPVVHIGLVPLSTLVPRLGQAMKPLHEMVEQGKLVPSFIGLISGPSSSADIEYKLVIGVHGPKIAHYVVIKDY